MKKKFYFDTLPDHSTTPYLDWEFRQFLEEFSNLCQIIPTNYSKSDYETLLEDGFLRMTIVIKWSSLE